MSNCITSLISESLTVNAYLGVQNVGLNVNGSKLRTVADVINIYTWSAIVAGGTVMVTPPATLHGLVTVIVND